MSLWKRRAWKSGSGLGFAIAAALTERAERARETKMVANFILSDLKVCRRWLSIVVLVRNGN